MDIKEIESNLESPDSQKRLKALTELRKNDYKPAIAVPLILTRKNDREFIVRSFVAMALGRKQTPEAYMALLEISKFDQDHNVRAEAADALSLYGQISVPHLLDLFIQDYNWLVRISILAALCELDCPEELFKACLCALKGEEQTVRSSAIEVLGFLEKSAKKEEALAELLKLVNDDLWNIRTKVAYALKKFTDISAKEALAQLKQDSDHRVVAAALETSVIEIEGRD
jgi:HEAT repeat protein